MTPERRSWSALISAAGSRRRRPWALTGLLVVMLGGTWLMQGFDLIDGAFFSNRLVSVIAGGAVIVAGVALMLGITGRSAGP